MAVPAVLAFAALLVLAPAPAGTAVTEEAVTEEAVARVVASGVGPGRLPGVSVAVVHGGEVLHTSGHGEGSDGRPVTADTPMRIGSLSKSFTALAVQSLEEEGALDLDDPVAAHLPGFGAADPLLRSATVRDLLDHGSGLSDASHPDARLPQPGDLARAEEALAGARAAAAPGEAFAYHNPNYWAAARVVEAASGTPFEEYLRTRVLDPLGMRDTVAVDDAADPVPGLADGYNRIGGVAVPRAESGRFVAGSAGIVTTADDLARWLALHTSPDALGGRVLSARGLAEAHRPSSPDATYALGWDVPATHGGERRIGHTGSSGTASAVMVVLPDTGYGVAVLANARMPLESDLEAVVEGLVDLVSGRVPAPAGAPAALIADLTASALALGALTAGGWTALRADRWAARVGRSRWRAAAGLLPWALPVPVAVLLPDLLGRLTGRAVPWALIGHIWASLAAVFVAAALAGAAVVAARAAALRRR